MAQCKPFCAASSHADAWRYAGIGGDIADRCNAATVGTCVVRAHRPDNERIVITGMGVASVFGNDVDTFYDS